MKLAMVNLDDVIVIDRDGKAHAAFTTVADLTTHRLVVQIGCPNHYCEDGCGVCGGVPYREPEPGVAL